jgi:NAD-dependent dihydropyrimidine dehydrogenase PreA subunit
MPVRIDYHKCVGCKACYRECPSDCYTWDEEKDIPVVTYPKECWHCGICEFECPAGAIDVSLPPQCWTEINKRFIAPLGKIQSSK